MKTLKKLTGKQKEQLAACYNALLDKKAEDVRVLDLRGVSGIADFFIICHGGSQRQVQALSDNVEMAARQGGFKDYHIEGKEPGNWILLDFHDIVVHVFHQTARAFYALESLWGDARRLTADDLRTTGG